MNFESLDNNNVPEEPDFGNVWDSIEQEYERLETEPNAYGNLPVKQQPQSKPIVEQLLKLAKLTDGIATLSVYPDGSGSVKVEYIFTDTDDIGKAISGALRGVK